MSTEHTTTYENLEELSIQRYKLLGPRSPQDFAERKERKETENR